MDWKEFHDGNRSAVCAGFGEAARSQPPGDGLSQADAAAKSARRVIDAHTHLLAARHASDWFEAADHYGIDAFVTMTPLEEALVLQRNYGHRLKFIAIPKWQEKSYDDWHRRLETFYNIGSRIIKFHMAPGTMFMRGWRLDTPEIRKLMREAADRGMILMSHVGDPDTWYNKKYDPAKYGTREEHYRLWEDCLREYRDHPWLGAHLGGNPEDLGRLQYLLDTYPNLYLDCSATRWMVREVSARRDQARDFFIRNQDRLIFGSDQVSGDDRHFDFLASHSGVIASCGRRRMSDRARSSIRICRRRNSR